MENVLTYVPYTKPFKHQQQVWEQSRDLKNFAVLWEQGTGKSKLAIDTIAHLYAKGEIDSAIVVAPNGVHRNWITDEIPTHLHPDTDIQTHAYKSESPITKRQQKQLDILYAHEGLRFLAISYDAWNTPLGKKVVWKILRSGKCILILDESHRIKTPKARRTRSILAGGKHAAYKRILSGTPITNGPFDIYSQMRFLDDKFWSNSLDLGSFGAFKSKFGVWEQGWNNTHQRQYDVLKGYQNIEELSKTLSLNSSRVTKKDVLDLPEKLYSKRYYTMSPVQRRVYESVENDFMAFLDGGELITTPLAITRMLRLQQVLCGYIPVDGDDEPTELIDPKDNPRLKLLRDTMEDVNGKTIIWAVYRKDVDLIMEALTDMGRRPVRYDGAVGDDDRQKAKDEFKNGDATDFVANSAMSEGLTLTEATTVIYYSNNYQLLSRKQSEDRAHRIGQERRVNYIDLVCPGTRDEEIIEALVKKSDIASDILGDEKEKWL